MASNHVQTDHSLQNAAIFGGDGQDGLAYSGLYSQGPNFSTTFLSDHQSPHLNGTSTHSPFDSTAAFSPPAWQTSTPAPASIPNAHAGQYLPANRGYYNLPTTTSANSYVGGHGAVYGQNVDPSLFRQADARAFSPSVAPAQTNSQSSNATVTPTSLQQGAPVGRPVAPPGSSMQGTFAAKPLAVQQQEASRAPAVDGNALIRTRVAPKGTQHGDFWIVSVEDLAKATKSTKLASFLNISSTPFELNLSKVNIPQYVPRKSQNELKALAASDPALKAKIMKRVKKTKVHIPKPGRTLPPATGKASPVSLSSETESSDEDSDYSDELDASPPPEKSPLPASRPQKAVEAVRYDTIKAVWFPRNKFVENERILKGLADLWEVVRTIRDRWKTDRDAVKKALEQKQDSELPLLRERVDKQLEMMEAVLKAAIEFGHPDLLSTCGQNTALMLVCYQFLLEPVREGNYTGTFIKAVFKFLSLCTNLSGAVAEKTGLSKLFSRSIKRGNEEVRTLTAKINENIASSDKKAKAARVSDGKSVKVADSPKAIKQEPEAAAGVKRPRSTEGSVTPQAKRVASSSVVPAGKETTAAAKLGLAKKPGAPTNAAPAAVVKTKTVKPATTTNFFAGLQSASKKPGTSNAAQAMKKGPAPMSADKKGPVPTTTVPAARPAFSFAETMATLSKEKKEEQQPAKKKVDEARTLETEEERTERLRKEERRKLRVRWKADFDLVQIRTFSPDPSEISGKTRNVRDVGNGKEREGFTLKKHMDMMDVDEEDDGQPMEQTFFDYNEPSTVDFSTLPEDERNRNVERFGGYQKVDSPERAVQDSHEATTLMVHYLAKSDIPPNPREPADPYTGPQLETKSFGYPDSSSPWLLDRLKHHTTTASAAPPQIDITALLQSISQQPQPVQPTAPVAPVAAVAPAAGVPDMSALQSIMASINNTNSQYQTSQQQPSYSWPPATQPAPVATDQAQPGSLESILAALGGGVQAPQQPAAAAPLIPTPQPPPAPPAAAPSSDVSALLASLMQNVQGGTASNAPPNAFQNLNLPGTGGQEQAQGAYYGASSTPPTQYTTTADSADNGDQSGNGAGGKKKWQGNASKKYTHACRFWKEGKCKKGTDCTFRHD